MRNRSACLCGLVAVVWSVSGCSPGHESRDRSSQRQPESSHLTPAAGSSAVSDRAESETANVSRASSPFVEEANAALSAETWEVVRADIYFRWAAVDPLAAISHARTHNRGSSTACIQQILAAWQARDPKAPFDWIRGQPAGVETSMFSATLLNACADGQIPGLADWVSSSLPAAGSGMVVNTFLNRWLKLAPKDAAQWALTFLSSENTPPRPELQVFLSNWLDADVEAVSSFLSSLPQGFRRDDAVRAFSLQAVSLDPAGALKWAESISNPELRAKTVSDLEMERQQLVFQGNEPPKPESQ